VGFCSEQLSMNLTWERWRPAGVSSSQKHQPAGETPALPGSWSQCMRKKRKGALHEPGGKNNYLSAEGFLLLLLIILLIGKYGEEE
jgi:hypothetical protein